MQSPLIDHFLTTVLVRDAANGTKKGDKRFETKDKAELAIGNV